MNRRNLSVAIFLGICTLAGPSFAQDGPTIVPLPIPILRPISVYSVKFVCGLQASLDPKLSLPAEPPVKPGNYATAVNIHNFHTFDVRICKRAVIAPPEHCVDNPATADNCPPNIVGTPRVVTLPAEHALEVDCSDIVSLLTPSSGGTTQLPGFIKGFVEVTVLPGQPLPAANPISVTGVYTALGCGVNADGATDCATRNGISEDVVPQSNFFGEVPKGCQIPTSTNG